MPQLYEWSATEYDQPFSFSKISHCTLLAAIDAVRVRVILHRDCFALPRYVSTQLRQGDNRSIVDTQIIAIIMVALSNGCSTRDRRIHQIQCPLATSQSGAGRPPAGATMWSNPTKVHCTSKCLALHLDPWCRVGICPPPPGVHTRVFWGMLWNCVRQIQHCLAIVNVLRIRCIASGSSPFKVQSCRKEKVGCRVLPRQSWQEQQSVSLG